MVEALRSDGTQHAEDGPVPLPGYLPDITVTVR
jgi:hypothetical protein